MPQDEHYAILLRTKNRLDHFVTYVDNAQPEAYTHSFNPKDHMPFKSIERATEVVRSMVNYHLQKVALKERCIFDNQTAFVCQLSFPSGKLVVLYSLMFPQSNGNGSSRNL